MFSMTGYGESKQLFDDMSISIQLSAVNHKYLSVHIKQNLDDQKLYQFIKNKIERTLTRGRVEAHVSISPTDRGVKPVLNKEVYEAHLAIYRDVSQQNTIDYSWILSQPEVIDYEERTYDESKLYEYVEQSLDQALEELISMRKEEGQHLKSDILSKLKTLDTLVSTIKEKSKVSLETRLQAYQIRIKEAVETYELDPGRMATEVAILTDKWSIDEELVRMDAHIRHFNDIIEHTDIVGKKLDFLLQEMHREINTLGTKSQDIDVLHLVVECKSIIDNLREQVQNLE